MNLDLRTRAKPIRLVLLCITLILIADPVSSRANPSTPSLIGLRLNAACAFLESLYNPALGLVRSTNDSSVYYTASDNLLAQGAMSHCSDPKAQLDAMMINQTIAKCCDGGNDHMHEILLNRPIKIPIHTSVTYPFANSSAGQYFNNVNSTTAGGDYTVLWEFHNSSATFQDCAYGDVAAYTALEYLQENNITGAQHETNCLGQMWDGIGIADTVYKSGTDSERGIYQTYKLALLAYTYARVYGTIPYDWTPLLNMQGSDGGFHTGYNQIDSLAGTRVNSFAGTKENAETTAITVIALSYPLPAPAVTCNCPMPILLPIFWLGIVAVATVLIVLVVWDRRRNKEGPRDGPVATDFSRPNAGLTPLVGQ